MHRFNCQQGVKRSLLSRACVLILAILFALPSNADFARGVAALKQGAYATAVTEFRESAAQGDALSQINLGSLYLMGNGVERNPEEAFRWFMLAARQGNYLAQHSVALCYYEGLGVPKDLRLAAQYYMLAAEHGYEDSQLNLAVMYARGDGVTRDPVQSYFWFDLAFENGIARAGVLRDRVSQSMSPRQLEQVGQLLRQWRAKKAK